MAFEASMSAAFPFASSTALSREGPADKQSTLDDISRRSPVKEVILCMELLNRWQVFGLADLPAKPFRARLDT
jgi:hypothetical protein